MTTVITFGSRNKANLNPNRYAIQLQVNAMLTSTGDPRVRIGDWNAVVGVYGDENITYDTIHPNQQGADLLAALVRDTVGRCP